MIIAKLRVILVKREVDSVRHGPFQLRLFNVSIYGDVFKTDRLTAIFKSMDFICGLETFYIAARRKYPIVV